MRPLRIVIALPEAPLPFGTAASRWHYFLINTLVPPGHNVTTLAPIPHDTVGEAVRQHFPANAFDLRLHTAARRSLGSRLHTVRWPFSSSISPEYEQELKTLMRGDVDVLHVEDMTIGWLALPYASRAVVNALFLLSIDWSMVRGGKLKSRMIRTIARRAESRLIHALPRLLTLTPRLTAKVNELNPHLPVQTVPLALDMSQYVFGQADRDPAVPTLGLIGSFNWLPSLEAGKRLLSQLWPAIHAQVPQARLQIVGRQASSAFAEFAASPNTTFHSDVPDAMPYFRSTDVLLYAPTPASGMKIKVMEAMAIGASVVTTEDGLEGLPARGGVHAGVADDNAGLVREAVRLLIDPSQRRTQCIAARHMLDEFCSPPAVLGRLMNAYANLWPRLSERASS